jgi:MSHA biogenesis protein MshJ
MKAHTTIDLELLRRRLAPLQKRWGRQAKRIDALSLRERAILFLAIVAVLALLFDTLVLSPLAARAKLRSEQQAQQATEIGQLREQFTTLSRNSADPAGQLRRQLEAAQAERARLDGDLRQASAINTGEGLSAVLQRLLGQQPGLVLERLTLLDDTPVVLPKVSPVALATGAVPAASAPAAQRPMLPDMPGMSWQGVELQVQGSYRDTQRYLQALERELPGLRWGEMRLSATNAAGTSEPPRLVAQAFLLKVQP